MSLYNIFMLSFKILIICYYMGMIWHILISFGDEYWFSDAETFFTEHGFHSRNAGEVEYTMLRS